MELNSIVINGLKLVRENNPLVHNITNFVVMNYSANVLLALGASPIMAHAPEEMEEMSKFPGSLVINIGTLDLTWINCMLVACRHAKNNNKPVILDPVGSGATKLRTDTAKRILEEGTISVIRGNASEIMSLSGSAAGGKGVDSLNTSEQAFNSAKELVERYNCVVAISGKTDIIVSKDQYAYVDGGHELLQKVTGTGCSLSAITGAFCSVLDDHYLASICSHAVLSIAAEIAIKDAKGPGSFQLKLLDALFNMNEKHINDMSKIKLFK